MLTLLFPHPLLRAELQMILDRFGLNGGGDSPVGRMVQKYRTFILKEA